MTVSEMFDQQLAVATPLSLELISERIADGTITENSDRHREYLAHVNDRIAFYLIYNVDSTDLNPMGGQTWKAEVKSCFESELSSVVDNILTTHKFDGFTTRHVPRFMLK